MRKFKRSKFDIYPSMNLALIVLSWRVSDSLNPVLDSFGQSKGGFKPSFGHRTAQNRSRISQNRTLVE